MEEKIKDLAPHVKRALDEYRKLTSKIELLQIFMLTDPIWMQLTEDKRNLMRMQEDAMKVYSRCLAMRLKLEGVRLHDARS